MNIICDMCGKTSTNQKVCSHCGAIIPEKTDMDSELIHFIWGWSSFDLSHIPQEKHSEIVEQIKEKLEELEEFTVLKLTNSQIENVVIKNCHVKLLLREDWYKELLLKLDNVAGSFEPVGYFSYASEANDVLKLQTQTLQ